VATMVRFSVSRTDVHLLMTELRDHQPGLLAALLQQALQDAAARLDTDASRLDTGRVQLAVLQLPGEHVTPFRQWLEQVTLRESAAGDPAKAQAFARVRLSERP
jgi:hypothetical protein